ncbi:reticulon-3-like [Rana temporaria]|uniref:reticulon-3-like n=1 Tax=Rana temporaria TaxID=8407 RepID=UPI001AAD6761|nr:reticulon-3-like [Rana temporaria]XP_040184996.1 reticulon-3-like [Rana temporaria]
MAESSVHQSSHISSSAGEKSGSCAESRPKHPSPESPGSPFEMIANSRGFDFQESEDKAINHGLSQMSTERPNQMETADEPLIRYTHPNWGFNEEESYGFMPHFRAGIRPDDLEPEIPVVEPNDNPKKASPEFTHEKVLPKSTVDERYLGQSLETPDVCGEAKDHSSAKREEPSYDFKSELRWADADDDMDSSGESDDTVIDAGWRVKSSELEQREHGEDGWVELHNAQQKNETKKENTVMVHEALANNSERLWSSQYSETQTTPLVDATDNLNKSASKTPESPHSEGFVDLADTYGTDPKTGVICYSESESLEDKVEENLTIEALRALADGTQDWNSESQESSPELLCPQFGSFEGLKTTEFQVSTDSFQDSSVDILTCKVHDLLYWRDVKKSGMVFGAIMVLLLSLAAFSIISVVSYLILSLLTVTIGFRIYKSVMQAVQKSDEGHPFKALLDQDITLSSDSFQKRVSSSLVHVNRALKYIVRLFLVEDLIDSLKLALFMWLMTYVGAVFNGITLLILGVLVAFIAPVVYEKYKVQIDHYVSLVHNQVKAITEKIQAKLPGALKKKTE